MTPLPKATCPVCGRTVAVRVTGQLREHLVDARTLPVFASTPPKCEGSGLHVAVTEEAWQA